MQIMNFDNLYQMAKTKKTPRLGAAGPAKPEVLSVLKRVQDEGLANLIFIGDTTWIFEMAKREEIDMTKVELLSEPDLKLPAAKIAVHQAREGKVQLLLNGYVSSQDMLQAVLDPKEGIVTGKAINELTAVELPNSSRLLFITAAGFNGKSGEKAKWDVLVNSLEYLKNLGLEEIRVAMLGTFPMQGFNAQKNNSSIDSDEEKGFLNKLDEKYPGVVLVQPKSLEEAMREAGPDLFLAPNVESGQILSQALTPFADGEAGQVVLGGEVPIALSADNTSEEQLFRSILMAIAGIVNN